MRELSLFSGVGGGLLGSVLLGWKTIAAVEIDPFCRLVLEKRQQDGLLERFPVFEDVRTFDPEPWAGQVDVVSSSFPCQDISIAGKGAGINGRQSSLYWNSWQISLRLRAKYLFLENSPALLRRGFSEILGQMAERGWDAEWVVLGAGHVGAPHIRERLWLLARNPDRYCKSAGPLYGEQAPRVPPVAADTDHAGRAEQRQQLTAKTGLLERLPRWPAEPSVCRVFDGDAAGLVEASCSWRRKRLHSLGNAQVPRVAASAFRLLHRRLES